MRVCHGNDSVTVDRTVKQSPGVGASSGPVTGASGSSGAWTTSTGVAGITTTSASSARHNRQSVGAALDQHRLDTHTHTPFSVCGREHQGLL